MSHRRSDRRAPRGTTPTSTDFGGGRQWMVLKELLPTVKDKLLGDVKEFVAQVRDDNTPITHL